MPCDLTILVFRQSLPVDNGDCLDFFERDVRSVSQSCNHRGGNPRQHPLAVNEYLPFLFLSAGVFTGMRVFGSIKYPFPHGPPLAPNTILREPFVKMLLCCCTVSTSLNSARHRHIPHVPCCDVLFPLQKENQIDFTEIHAPRAA